MNNSFVVEEEFLECVEKFDYVSYLLNFILLTITIISEIQGCSNCESNGIIDGSVKVLKRLKCRKKKEDNNNNLDV